MPDEDTVRKIDVHRQVNTTDVAIVVPETLMIVLLINHILTPYFIYLGGNHLARL